jgi:tRNA(Arg) A34 adenosine deaminase TadA
MNWKSHEYYIRKCIEVANEAQKNGNLPFGAVLVDPDGNIVLENGNYEITQRDYTGHAEIGLIVKASKIYSKDYLSKCTLYSNCEPCIMCAGAIYYSNVGRVIFGIADEMYREMTGDKSYPLMRMTSRELFKYGDKKIESIGPFNELAEEIINAMNL